MKRRLFPGFVRFAGLVAAALAVSAAACDPDLTPVTTPGEGGLTEGGAGEGGPTPIPTGDGGNPVTEGGTTEGGTDSGPGAHKVDGVNDFAPGEKLQTTSSATGYFAYVAWDTKNVYFGMEGDDVSAATGNANNKWVMLYLGSDGVTGTTTGINYNGNVQQPTLPFAAGVHYRWKVDGSYGNTQKWNPGNSKWEDAPLVAFTPARQGKLLELGVSRAALGDPSKLRVHMNMLIEGQGAASNDHTYAGVPSTSFADGKDPDFGKYFEFDLADLTKAPNTYAPK